MPTDEENVQYLYLVLTAGGPPTIDFGAVGKALDLKNGAVSKRWSRLKKAMNDGKPPGPSAYEFLWLLVKHSTRDKAPDWHDIAAKCNTTHGAASKRYSRMKQAFERGDAAPTSTVKGEAVDDTSDSPVKSTPKRKRTPAKKKASVEDEASSEDKVKKEEVEEEHVEDGDEEEQPKPKRSRPRAPAKPRAKKGAKKGAKKEKMPKPEQAKASVPPTEATTLIKTESQEYYDSLEFAAGGEVEDAEDEVAQDRVESWLEGTEV